MDCRKCLCAIIYIFLIINCGGGGGQYYPPKIAINKISVVKEEVKSLEGVEIRKIWLTVDLERQPLHQFFAEGIKFYYINGFQFQGNDYLIGIPIDNFVCILDSEGNIVKKLDTPRYSRNAQAIELKGDGNLTYLAVFVEQQATSHSSTLYIVDDKFNVVYKEHLLGALWMAIEDGQRGHNLIVSSENKWMPEGEWVYIGGLWRYYIFGELGGSSK